MSSGTYLRLCGAGIYVDPSRMAEIGIYDDSTCWGAYLPRDSVEGNRSGGHLVISAHNIDLWPLTFRIVIRLTNNRGSLAIATEALAQFGVAIQTIEATPNGRHHAICNILGTASCLSAIIDEEMNRAKKAIDTDRENDPATAFLRGYLPAMSAFTGGLSGRLLQIDRQIRALGRKRMDDALQTTGGIAALVNEQLKAARAAEIAPYDSLVIDETDNGSERALLLDPQCGFIDRSWDVAPLIGGASKERCKLTIGSDSDAVRHINAALSPDRPLHAVLKQHGLCFPANSGEWLSKMRSAKRRRPVDVFACVNSAAWAMAHRSDGLNVRRFRYDGKRCLLQPVAERGEDARPNGAGSGPSRCTASFDEMEQTLWIRIPSSETESGRLRIDVDYTLYPREEQPRPDRRVADSQSIGLLAAATGTMSSMGIDIEHVTNRMKASHLPLRDGRKADPSGDGTVALESGTVTLFARKQWAPEQQVRNDVDFHFEIQKRVTDAVRHSQSGKARRSDDVSVRVRSHRSPIVFFSHRRNAPNPDVDESFATTRSSVQSEIESQGFEVAFFDSRMTPIGRGGNDTLFSTIERRIRESDYLVQFIQLSVRESSPDRIGVGLAWLRYELGLADAYGVPYVQIIDMRRPSIRVAQWHDVFPDIRQWQIYLYDDQRIPAVVAEALAIVAGGEPPADRERSASDTALREAGSAKWWWIPQLPSKPAT